MSIEVNVTPTEVKITNTPTINQGEYNINSCNFTFSSEYDNLIKRAVFTNILGKSYLVEIENNTCTIPAEVLSLSGIVVLGVYAYTIENEQLVLRYSPTRTSFDIEEGSYISNTNTVIPPKESLDLMQKVNDLVNDIQTKLDTGYFKGDKGDPGQDGKDGIDGKDGENGVDGHDGVDGQDGQDAKINGVNTLTIEAGSNINLEQEGNTLTISSTGGGTSNYQNLTNKPSINNVTLTGNKSLNDLGIQAAGNYITNEADPTVPSYVKNITQSNIDSWNNKSDFSGNYNDLTNRPTIPAEVTENTVSGWGFTKNTGTYSKPQNGIPKTDLETAVQTSLDKADTALQAHQDISGKANKISVVQTSTSAIEINSNTFYKFGEVASLNITLASITDNTIYNEYMFEFVSGTTATTLTLPSSIKWLETPTIDANKIYQCSIVDNVGLLVGVANV